MFDITGDDVAQLNDVDLRSLVGLLCEAELRHRGLSAAGVTWGGHQNAADGGLDVSVALDQQLANSGFVPRSMTGYQSKAENMPRADIIAEMRPDGTVRSSIKELADRNGAYVIVSSKGSVSDPALRDRRKAMREAIADLANAEDLVTDFYDRNRMASWVRNHGSLIAWVRERVNRPIPGWRSYEPWAYPGEGLDAEYILDESITIRIPGKGEESGHLPIDGINVIRHRLASSRGVVRLVGLSGVGKTRFAQALFDNRIGIHPLDRSLVYYTNLSDDPSPSPVNHASALVTSRERAILVIDNCTPELHRRLSEVARSLESEISVLTIEYDIGEDQPEGTDVFKILKGSNRLIESLLTRRYESLSQVDTRTIAEFSGGNARVAIALAATVEQDESISGLKDEELFRRLFHQRHQPDDSLLHSAQICSLVYSFDVETTSTDGASELALLAQTTGITASSLFRDVAELMRRNLVQQRGVWRAVLPHAIANRLAGLALQNMSYASLQAFINACNERLLKSFSRRLGYLHDSLTAQRLVGEWFSANGYLSNLPILNDFGQSMLENVAPVAPGAILMALERHISSSSGSETLKGCQRYRSLIRSLAYDKEYFDRALELLAALNEQEQNDAKQGQDEFESLFQLHLSGTHATIEQRLAAAERLLRSSSAARNKLGLSALDGLLEAWHFSGFRGFEFGALSRDYGYWPASRAEIVKWFSLSIALCTKLIREHLPIAGDIRRVLGEKLRGLWSRAQMFDELETACKAISEIRFWPEGWLGACSIRQYDSKGVDEETHKRLETLLSILKPSGLTEEVRSLLLSRGTNAHWDFDFEAGSDFGSILRQKEIAAYELGKRVAAEPTTFDQIISELLVSDDHGDLGEFARGLIDGADDPKLMWRRVLDQFLRSPKSYRAVSILCACISALNFKEAAFVDEILESSVQDPNLGEWFPALQRRVPVSPRTVDRLKRSLSLGKAPLHSYNPLSFPYDALPAADFEELVTLLMTRQDSFEVAVDLIGMRIFVAKQTDIVVPEPIRRAARTLFGHFQFAKCNNRDKFYLAEIASVCLDDPDAAILVEELFSRLRSAFAEFAVHTYDTDDVIRSLMNAQPLAALNGLFPVGLSFDDKAQRVEWGITQIHGFVPNRVSSEGLLLWCEQDAQFRFRLVASLITPFQGSENGGQAWSDFALLLLGRSPHKIAVLEEYVRKFSPRSWSGSRVQTVELNAKLLDVFLNDEDETVAQFAREQTMRICQSLATEREWEAKHDKVQDERFE